MFELLPDEGIVRVTVTVSVADERSGAHDRWGPLVVPAGATDVRSQGATVSDSRYEGGMRGMELAFDRPSGRGPHRATVTYDLATSPVDAPIPVRITDGYASFCWYGQATVAGTVVARLPAGYEHLTPAEDLDTLTTADGVELRLHGPAGPWVAACTDAFDPARLRTTRTTTASGRGIVIQAWPDDPRWAGVVTGAVKRMVPALEAEIGLPIPGSGDLRIREVAVQSLQEYAGLHDDGASAIHVSEVDADQSVVAHELAHAWFDGSLSHEAWIVEGLATYLEMAAQDDYCTTTYATEVGAPLSDWTYLTGAATDDERWRVGYQYAAACFIHQAIADAIGEDRMRAVMQVLLTDGRAYGWSPGPVTGLQVGRAEPVDWREWLDVVEEVGLLPAGADPDLATRMLLDFGIATEADLRGRADAKAAYRTLAASLGEVRPPQVVRDRLDAWRFVSGREVIDVATQTAGVLRVLQPGRSPEAAAAAWAAFSDAETVEALRAVLDR